MSRTIRRETGAEGRAERQSMVMLVTEESGEHAAALTHLSPLYRVALVQPDPQGLLDRVQCNPPDVLIVDFEAWRSCGNGFRAKLAQRLTPAPLSVICISPPEQDLAVEALTDPADAYLANNWSRLELLTCVRNVLALSALHAHPSTHSDSPTVDADDILANVSEAIITVGSDWRIAYMNRAAEHAVRMPSEDAVNRLLWDVFTGARHPRFEADYRRAMIERRSVKLEAADERQGGGWYEVNAVPLSTGGLGLFFRSTDQVKQANEQAQESESRLNMFTEHASDYALVLLDVEGRVVEWLGGAEAITGWSAAERLGQPIDDLFTLADQACGRVQLERELAATNGRAEDTRWHRSKDGSLFFADGVTTARYDNKGTLQGFAKIFRNRTEQKLAEEALRQSREQFQLLLNSVADGICGIALDNSCTFLNPAAAAMLGFSPEEVIGQSFHQLVHHHKEDGSLHHEADCKIIQALKQGTAVSVDDEVFWRKDETSFPVHYSVNTIVHEGRTTGAVIAFHDTTGPKRIEAALRESERRLRFVIDAMPQKVFTASDSGEADYFNPPWLSYTGLTMEQVSGWKWTQFVHADDIDRTLELWKQSLSGQTFQVEHRFRNAEGAYRWHLTRAQPLHDDRGRVILWVGASTDIHAIKTTEAELASQLAAEQRNAHLLAQVAVASRTMHTVLSVDNIARVLVEQVRSILQVHQSVVLLNEDDEWKQVTSFSDKYAEFRDHQIPRLEESIYAEVCRLNRPLRLKQAELELHPSWRALESSGLDNLPARGWLGVPLIGHGRKNIGLIQVSDKNEGEFNEDDEAILTQLAVIAAVGIENARLYDSLREQDQRKNEFLATLAHELRNPLAPLRTGLDLLKLPTNNRPEHIRDMMERQLAHMVRLVDDLMDVSRVSRGKVELKWERIELKTIVDVAVETSLPVIQSARHTLDIAIPEEPLYLRGDLTRLAQILNNLLNNAAKYTEEGGAIKLFASRQGPQVAIQIQDSGVGLSKEMLNKVFELFTQVDPCIKRSQGGLGIGLSLVQKLVEMHGGTVSAESPGIGQGSRFTVTLPLADDLAATEQPALGQASPPTQAALRLLVVDDNQDAAETLAMLLRFEGHEVLTAHSGKQGIETAMASHPQAIFLDIGLPDLSGYEVAAQISGQPDLADVLLIALTGWGSEEDRRRAKEAGFHHHLVKPVELKSVSAVLEQLLPVHSAPSLTH